MSRCPHCNGTVHRDWEGDYRCLLCGRATYLAPPPTSFTLPDLPVPRDVSRLREAMLGNRNAAGKLTDADVAAIRAATAGLGYGKKEGMYRQLAAQYGVSVPYVQLVATGRKRTHTS